MINNIVIDFSLDVKLQSFTELCLAITHTEAIPVWEHIFAPKEYLSSQLEEFFAKLVHGDVVVVVLLVF